MVLATVSVSAAVIDLGVPADATQASAIPSLNPLNLVSSPQKILTDKQWFTLVVLRDETLPSALVPADARALLRLATSNTDDSRRLNEALGSPIGVRELIVERPSDEYVAALKPGDTEHRLLNYVLLHYADAKASTTAKDRLVAQRIFRSVQADTAVEFSATPNDPYFAPAQPSPLNKQWGMTAMDLPTAWDTQTGYAYIGVVDNGIALNHPDLAADRTGNVRAHFSGSWNSSSPSPWSAGFSEPDDPPFYITGHGSHVAGIIGATANNGTGVSGTCHNCSLAIARTTGGGGVFESNVTSAIYGMVGRGVQAINLSLGSAGTSCGGSPAALPAYCDAIQWATDRDVIIVAAAGNYKTQLQFPASDVRTISVGGYQANGALWDQTIALGADSPARDPADGVDEIGTNFGSNQWVVAPARDVLSTMATDRQWAVRCGSVAVFDTAPPRIQFVGSVVQSIFAVPSGNRYGICTGTSMAAPHISGLVGLMRSTNPLLTRAEIRSRLAQAAGGTFLNDSWGYGLPNASIAVVNALPIDRLTPLFAFSNTAADDFVYTVFPQMGAALNSGSLPPFVGTSTSTRPYYSYPWIGNTVTQYPTAFPGVTIMMKPPQVTRGNYVPRALLRVFTTPKTASGVSLWPVCRFSYLVGATSLRHIIDTAPTCAQSNLPAIAILDGQEGYVFPPNQPQPSGTVPVIRMELIPGANVPTVFIFTAQTDQAYYSSQGFFNPVVLGYAYLN